jgi:uncharacterized protein (TIGR00369 family)
MPAHATGPRRSAEEQNRLEREIRQLYERKVAFHQLLGLRVLSLDPAAPRIRFDMRPELVGHVSSGRLHGGVTATVLDSTAGLALMLAISEKFADESAVQVLHRIGRMGTIDMRIDYLRQGVGRFFIAGARVTRLGGRIGSAHMELHGDDGALVATGAASYVIS